MSDITNIRRCGDFQMACIVIQLIYSFTSEHLRLNYNHVYFLISTVYSISILSFVLLCLLNIIFAIRAKAELGNLTFRMLLSLNFGFLTFLIFKALLAA